MWKWTKRVLLGFAGLLVVAIAVALIAVHTDWGRGLVRTQVQARLETMFTGGATIGKLEGSPFGTLVVRDLVINGPDKKPAITVKRLALKLGIMPLISKQARLAGVTAEDVEVLLKRDEHGELAIKNLMTPAPKSGWSVDIPEVAVHRAHVALDNRTEWVNLDGLEIAAGLHMAQGKPVEANANVTGTWRERGAAKLDVRAEIKLDEELIQVPSLSAKAGDVSVVITKLRMVKPGPNPFTPPALQPPTTLDGEIVITAPKAAVARLAPGVELPDDIAATIKANALPVSSWTHLDIDAKLGTQPIRALLDADLDHLRARGMVSTGALELGHLSKGKLEGVASAVVVFDGAAPEPGKLPVGNAMVHAWGELAGIPSTAVTLSLRTTPEEIVATLGAGGKGATAQLYAKLHKVGEAITLDRGTLVANVSDPARATGGKAPAHGVLSANLTASGRLAPEPSLAVAGRIAGKKLRVQDLSIATLDLAIDAQRLPSHPMGRAELKATDIVRGTMWLRTLAVTGANREDGKIAVAVRTQPKQNPWLVEADALVTPGSTVTVDLLRHRVRAGNSDEWTGHSGKLIVGPRRIELRELASSSADGKLAAAALFDRRTGDLDGHFELATFSLATVDQTWKGVVDARVDVQRRAGRFAGTVDLHGKGIAVRPSVPSIDVDGKIEGKSDQLVVDLTTSAVGVGTVAIAADIDAPKDITDAVAWRTLGRRDIRSARLRLEHIDVAKLAELANMPSDGVVAYRGSIDGDIQVSADSTGGAIQIRDLMVPALASTGAVNAELNLSQTAIDELTPSLTARVEGLGSVEAQATLAMPNRVFDPAAWKQLGRGAIKSASVRAADLAFDPTILDRFGITTNLRGRISVTAEVEEAVRSAKLAVNVRQLRGAPIALPVDVDFTAAIDDAETKATLEVRSKAGKLLELTGYTPVSISELEADPRSVRNQPIKATATLPSVAAPTLLATLGRTEITGGTITGTVDVAGTVGKPTVRARLGATGLAVPPGPGGRPIKTIERLALDATWDGQAGSLELDATQAGGMLHITASGAPTALAEAKVQLQAKQFDLVPLLAFAPGPAGGAAGRLDADVTVRGLDPRTMKMAGKLHLENGRVPIAPAVGTLRRAKIDVAIDDQKLTLAVDGRMGGGTVKANGTIAMAGAAPTGGEATITLRKVSPIGAVQPIVDADVQVKLRKEPDRYYADVAIRNAVVKVPDKRGEKLDEAGAPADMVFVTGGPDEKHAMKKEPPARPVVAAHIALYSTYVESTEIRGLVKGTLDITAGQDAIGISGRVAADRGDLDLFGRRYQLERAEVRFDGTPDPILDVQITHDFPEVTTYTTVRGRASKPELTLSANPGIYSQGQLLGFLLGGEPDGEPSSGNPRDRVTAAGASIIANQLGGYVKKALPIDIDVLRYESATASNSAAVTVGTWLTRELFIAYRRRLESRPDENAGEGEVEYWISRRVMVEGTIGDRGYNGVDLLWRKRY